MNVMRTAALVLILFCCGRAAANTIPTAEIIYPQLDAILAKAMSQSPTMLSNQLDLEIAEHNRIAARAGLLPSLGGGFRYYEAEEKRADLNERMRVPKTYYDVTLKQPVFHWGERRNNARAGEIREMIAQGNYREAFRAHAQRIRELYYRLIIGKIRVERARFYHQYVEEQKKQGEERLARKLISDAQFFSLRMAAERALIDLERTAFAHEGEKTEFARLTGGVTLSAEDIPDHIPAIQPGAEAIAALVSDFRGQSEVPTEAAVKYRHSIEIEKLSLANDRTRLRPKFDIVFGVDQDEQRYTATGRDYLKHSYFSGVVVSWSIFDGFTTRSRVRAGLATLRRMENDYRQLTESLAVRADDQVREAGFLQRLAAISDLYLESAEGNLKAKQEQVTRGVNSQRDVDQAKLGLYDSQISAYAARADYYMKIADLLGTVAKDPVLTKLARTQ